MELTDEADGVVIADAVKWVPVDAAPNSVTWPLAVAQSGEYAVYARWTAHGNRATDAPYTIHHADGTATVSVNQQQGAGDWHLLGTYNFNAGANHSIQLTDQADGYVIADAVKLVATGQTGGSAGGVFYVHTDHLGTPKVITDENQQVAWQADYAPFGEATVTTAAIENLLRFPGQYFDQETGLHYNYFRDYDPRAGRYIQADPLGLRGGPNVYSYAHRSPLVETDRKGLFGSVTFNAFKRDPYRLPPTDAAAIGAFSDRVIIVGAVSATAAPAAIAGFAEGVGASTAAMCRAASKLREPLKKLCKTGILAGSLICTDREGNWEPLRDLADDFRRVEDITRSARQPKLPAKAARK